MPKLDWIGKDKVISHHLDVPVRTLEHKYGFRGNSDDISETGSGNMIIHGDNLEALKALLPKFEGRINCIYIDPPYNTGNEKWVYNDNVNDPKIKKWLGEVVGTEGEDLCRHDKWLCMMYPRLKLMHQLLSETGAIFISCDENELYSLKLICDEIFGSRNFIGQWNWFKSATPPNLSYKIKRNLEYVLCYEKIRSSIKYKGIQKVSPSDDPLINGSNANSELIFPINSLNFKGKDGTIVAGTYGTAKNPTILLNDMVIINGKNVNPVRMINHWRWGQANLENELSLGTKVSCSKSLVISHKKAVYDPEVPPNLIDFSVGVNTTEEAGKLLSIIFGSKVFDFPKDVGLIQYLINFLCDKNAIILDAFAGSGTTGHAVLNLNSDGGNRKFIMIEMENYAEEITSERIRRVISGYGEGDKNVEGTGGSFDFFELGEKFFTDEGLLNENISEEKIREYVYYTETRQPLTRSRVNNSFLLDTFNNTGFYFYYKPHELTTFGPDTLKIVTERADSYVVYADKCTLSDDYMLKHNIVFKKIPRDIKQF